MRRGRTTDIACPFGESRRDRLHFPRAYDVHVPRQCPWIGPVAPDLVGLRQQTDCQPVQFETSAATTEGTGVASPGDGGRRWRGRSSPWTAAVLAGSRE